MPRIHKELLKGQRFNNWEVITYIGQKHGSRAYFYRCRCLCGSVKEVNAGHLTGGNSKSCGCLRTITAPINGRKTEKPLRPGQRYGYYEVIGKSQTDKNGHTNYKVKCHSCGGILTRSRSSVLRITAKKCQHKSKHLLS